MHKNILIITLNSLIIVYLCSGIGKFLFSFLWNIPIKTIFSLQVTCNEGLVWCISMWWRTNFIQLQQPNFSYRWRDHNNVPNDLQYFICSFPNHISRNKKRGTYSIFEHQTIFNFGQNLWWRYATGKENAENTGCPFVEVIWRDTRLVKMWQICVLTIHFLIFVNFYYRQIRNSTFRFSGIFINFVISCGFHFELLNFLIRLSFVITMTYHMCEWKYHNILRAVSLEKYYLYSCIIHTSL